MTREYPSIKRTFVKRERLKSFKDFKRICSRGERVRTKNFIIYALLNDLKLSRLGLTVSAKVTNSPGRSRIKRLLREFFRLNKILFTNQSSTDKSYELNPEETGPPATQSAPAGHIVPGFRANTLDVVIIAKKAVARNGLEVITEELPEALLKLNRLIAGRTV